MIHAQSIRSGLASALGLFSLLALSACTVGPDYRTPDTAAAKIDATASKPYDRSRFESLWWKQFDDPTLNQLVEQSLSGNRDLRVAFARLRAARALRDDVANDRFPVVTSRASADIGKGQQPGVTEDRVNSERYDLGLDSAWELDLFGRIRRQLESSDALSEAAEADLQQLQVSLIAELVDAYGQLRGAQLREKIALSNLENQKESRQLTEQLRDAGVGAELDVLRADARLAATAASVPQLQAEAERARHRIATLLGQRPEELTVDLSPRDLPAITKALPIGDPGELLRRRPDIRAAERRLAASTADVGVATADLFPRVSLSGFLGFTAGRGSQIATGGDPLPRRHHRFPGAAGRRTRATLRRRCPGPGRGRAVPRHRGDLPLPRRWLATQRLNRLSPGRWKSATPAPRLQLLVAGLFYAQRGGSVEPHVVSRRWRRGSAAIAAGYSRRSGCAEWIYRV